MFSTIKRHLRGPFRRYILMMTTAGPIGVLIGGLYFEWSILLLLLGVLAYGATSFCTGLGLSILECHFIHKQYASPSYDKAVDSLRHTIKQLHLGIGEIAHCTNTSTGDYFAVLKFEENFLILSYDEEWVYSSDSFRNEPTPIVTAYRYASIFNLVVSTTDVPEEYSYVDKENERQLHIRGLAQTSLKSEIIPSPEEVENLSSQLQQCTVARRENI